MNPEALRDLISGGELEQPIEELLKFVKDYYTRFAPEVIIISSRYNQIQSERRANTLPLSDYKIEINSIARSLLQIIDSVEGLSEKNFKPKKGKEDILPRIQDLERRFAQSRKKAKAIQSNPTRLREKNDIARELGEIFINHSELIESYYGTDSEGIITGISNRYKRVPEIDGIDFFESILPHVHGNFTRCCIVNALAEIIYTGQLRFGDDQRIYKILDILHPDAAPTVGHNITRVNAELDYFLGKIIPESKND